MAEWGGALTGSPLNPLGAAGGTIPVVQQLREILGVPVALMGFARPDDRIHGPNEKFHLANLARGAVACERFFELAAFLPRTRGVSK